MSDLDDRDYSPDELGPVCLRCKAPVHDTGMLGRPYVCDTCDENHGTRRNGWEAEEARYVHDVVMERLALMTEAERCAYLERLIERSKTTLARTKEQLR